MRTRFRIAAAALAAVLAAGACPAQEGAPPPAPPPAAPAVAPASSAPPPAVTLAEAVRQALESGREGRIRKNDASIARLGTTRAEAGRLPRIDAGGEYYTQSAPPAAFIQGREIQLADQSDWRAHVTAEQTIYDFGRTGSRVRQSVARADAGDLDVLFTRERLAMDAIAAFLGARRAEEIRDVARETLDVARAHRQDAGDLDDGGVVAKNDLLAADVGVANAEAGVSTAETFVEVARSRLALRMGLPGSRTVAPAPDNVAVPAGPLPPLTESVEAAYRNRIELKGQDALIREGQAQADGAGAEFYPAFFGQGGYQYETNSINPHKSIFTLLLGGRINLFAGGADEAAKRQASLLVVRRKESRDLLRDEIALDVKAAQLAVTDASMRKAAADVAVARAEENLRIQNDRYREGLAISTEVQDAQNLLSHAKVDQRNAAYDEIESRYRWLYARGDLLAFLSPLLQ